RGYYPNPNPGSHVGDAGIWIFDAGGLLQEGPWPISSRSNFVYTLDTIAHRQWSIPVDGLAAWGDLNFSLVLKNVSKSNILVPDGQTSGFVRLSIKDTNGSVSHWRLVVDMPGLIDGSRRLFRESETNSLIVRDYAGQPKSLRCINLRPGETFNLCSRQTLLHAARNSLDPGRYTVTIGCQNITDNVKSWDAAGNVISLTPWTGELDVPPFQIDVPPLAPGQKAS